MYDVDLEACVKNPGWTNPYQLFKFNVIVAFIIVVAKESIKCILMLWYLYHGHVPVSMRLLCKTSIFFPLCIFAPTVMRQLVGHEDSYKDNLIEFVMEALLEDVLQLSLQLYYTWGVTSVGLGLLGQISICVSGLSLTKYIATALLAAYSLVRNPSAYV